MIRPDLVPSGRQLADPDIADGTWWGQLGSLADHLYSDRWLDGSPRTRGTVRISVYAGHVALELTEPDCAVRLIALAPDLHAALAVATQMLSDNLSWEAIPWVKGKPKQAMVGADAPTKKKRK